MNISIPNHSLGVSLLWRYVSIFCRSDGLMFLGAGSRGQRTRSSGSPHPPDSSQKSQRVDPWKPSLDETEMLSASVKAIRSSQLRGIAALRPQLLLLPKNTRPCPAAHFSSLQQQQQQPQQQRFPRRFPVRSFSSETIVDAEFETRVHEWGEKDTALGQSVEIEAVFADSAEVRAVIDSVQAQMDLPPDIQFTQANMDVKAKVRASVWFSSGPVFVHPRTFSRLKLSLSLSWSAVSDSFW